LGLLLGASTFNNKGIGKSTPTNKASPSPKIGKNDNIFLFADDAALSIAFLSWSFIRR